MNESHNFSETECRRAMTAAIISACFGAVSQIMIRESSLVILYASKLGAGRFLALFSTSAQLLSICIFIIPVSYLMEHTGKKPIVLPAIAMTMVGVLVIAAAGFFRQQAQRVLLAGLLVFAVSLSVYIAGWFPLLKGIVPEGMSSRFFGRLRMSWQLVVTLFLFGSYFFIGPDASVATLQTVIALAGVLILGRLLLVMRIPESPVTGNVPRFLDSIREVVSTRTLVMFGSFVFLFSLFSDSTIPVAYIFARESLGVSDKFFVLLSVFVNVGSMLGFALGGVVFTRGKAKTLMISGGSVLVILNCCLLMIRHLSGIFSVLFILIVTLYAVIVAAVFVGTSAKMLTLARGKIVNISLAVIYAFQTAGRGLSRIGSGVLLESGIFPSQWTVMDTSFSEYHGFFVSQAVGLVVVLIVARHLIRKAGLNNTQMQQSP